MKLQNVLPALLLLALAFELAAGRLPVMTWFWLHAGLLLAVVIAGALAWPDRRWSYHLLSAGFVAALAGIGAYLTYPLFETPVPPSASMDQALAAALGEALGPLFFASIGMTLGLIVGWLPSWLYQRSRHVA